MLRYFGKLYGPVNMVSELSAFIGFTVFFSLTHLKTELLHFFLYKIRRGNDLFKDTN